MQSRTIAATDDYFICGTETGEVYKAVFAQGKTLDVNKITKPQQQLQQTQGIAKYCHNFVNNVTSQSQWYRIYL